MSVVYPWQGKSWIEFNRIFKQGRLPHAIILSGKEGMGLGHFAHVIANDILCQNNQHACGECKNCHLFAAGNHQDLFSVTNEDNAKQIKVDQIRELIDFIQLKSFAGNAKIVVIDPADTMNRNASNTLLTTLEEPPDNSLLLLISHRPAVLPVTIRSRCQIFNLDSDVDENTLDWISTQIDDAECDPEALLELANGAPLLAVTMQNNHVAADRRTIINEFLTLLENKSDPLEVASHWNALGSREVLEWLLKINQEMARYKISGNALNKGLLEFKERLQHHIKRLNLVQLSDSYDLVLKQYRMSLSPINLNTLGLLEELTLYWRSRLTEQRG